ncbi:unnamed protein product, partial [Urochloa humidicola]
AAGSGRQARARRLRPAASRGRRAPGPGGYGRAGTPCAAAVQEAVARPADRRKGAGEAVKPQRFGEGKLYPSLH